MSDPFLSQVNKDNSKVGSHVRFERFMEKDRIIIVGYTITRYDPTDHDICLVTAHEYIKSKCTKSSDNSTILLDQLSGCVVRITYAAAIYNEKDWKEQVKKNVSKQLRATVLSRLDKCPITVPIVDTHVQAEFDMRHGEYVEVRTPSRFCTKNAVRSRFVFMSSVPYQSRRIMHTTLRKLVRKYGVRGERMK
jgi:hypothetical protein